MKKEQAGKEEDRRKRKEKKRRHEHKPERCSISHHVFYPDNLTERERRASKRKKRLNCWKIERRKSEEVPVLQRGERERRRMLST